MADRESVGGRMKQARLQAAVRLGETISQERMAELVSAELGRVLHPTQWRRYESDREPPLDIIIAAARVSGLSEGYIAFGEAKATKPPVVPPTPGLTAGEKLARAMEAGRSAPRGAQLEPKDVAAPDPRKKASGAADKGKGKRAG